MANYFDRVEEALGDALERHARRPWYGRMLRLSRVRGIAVVLAALIVGTPAIGAAAGWFNFGQPNVPPRVSAGVMYGQLKPGSARLLPLRVADPDGGPPWGLRLVKTGRGDTCLQFGRVEDGQLGSLGIDGAWNNDHLFHAISPKDSLDDQCGSTDAAGDGYVNVVFLGTPASADIYHQNGGRSKSCELPQYMNIMPGLARRSKGLANPAPGGDCPASAGRVIALGLLGPDAESVTYRQPGGALATTRTYGGVGAYMLVFPYDEATCHEYGRSAHSTVSCDSFQQSGATPPVTGAVTKITYKDGRSCSLTAPAKLESAYRAFVHSVIARLGQPPRPTEVRFGLPAGRAWKRWQAAYQRLLTDFRRREHLTLTEFRDELGPVPMCPAVGWVADRGPKVTTADVKTPIMIKTFPAGRNYGCPPKIHLPEGCNGLDPGSGTPMIPIEWSFKARRAVTDSRSWYEWWVSTPTGTGCMGGGSSFTTDKNIKQNQILHYSQFFRASCHGTYSIIVGYTPGAPSSQSDDGNTGGGYPGRDGSLVVGRATFTIH